MRLLVVSDLHIHSDQDPIYVGLIRLINEQCRPGDVLVLGGDVFDLFVGNKPVFMRRYQRFFDSLKQAGSRGVAIHYIEGNHDFQIRGAFREIPGFALHSRDLALELEGKRFFIAHGDLVDRGDYGYLALRAFFRSPPMKAVVFLAPGFVVEKIGSRMSRYSRCAKPVLPTDLPIERAAHLRKVYRSFAAEKLQSGFDFVVLGHSHDLDQMRFQVAGRSGQYINVGFPRIHQSFLIWERGESEIQRQALPIA